MNTADSKRAEDCADSDGRESLAWLVSQTQEGSREAFDRLLERYVPLFLGWASGRLPAWARSTMDTEDLVQESVLHLIEHGPEFRPEHEASVLCYLRTTLKNRIHDQMRRRLRRGPPITLPDELAGHGDSPLDVAIEHQKLERYEQALERLCPAERDLIIARLELGLSWREVAAATARPNAEAARSAAKRAVRKLTSAMRPEAPDGPP